MIGLDHSAPGERPAPTRARTALLAASAVLLLAGVVELAAFAVENMLAASGVVYRADESAGDENHPYLRDPVLGWTSTWPDDQRDASGSRIVPAFPDSARPACMSLYGDSFTWAADVAPESAWGNVLSQRLGCRVSNFGVPGYGTDQAYLRFKTNAADRAPTVLLCHLSENIARNVNQFRALLSPRRAATLKPRFILGPDGGLELVPVPTLTAEEFARLVREPEAYLTHEALLPGTEWGPTRGGFPHTLSVLATLRNRRILAYLSGAYYWQDFYRAEHPTQALGITVAIIDAFVRDARQQQRRGAVVVFPTRGDLVARGRGKPWSYQPLLAALQARGLTPLNVGDGLFERLPQGDPDAIIGAAGQHYNELGNRLVAEIVGRFIEENGLRPSANEEHS